jgi:hypothetical protein
VNTQSRDEVADLCHSIGARRLEVKPMMGKPTVIVDAALRELRVMAARLLELLPKEDQ